ncbi:hypothetical protein AB1Y20_020737 [Prymnesium parvum]|uniref:RING-CH-type domain-containing protein n=1 Tax=Prymnesium parvum TaxID=97485 RepID=A0AB34JZ04_PRYPA
MVAEPPPAAPTDASTPSVLARSRRSRTRSPQASDEERRGLVQWSSGTFACHQQPELCALSTACPCVQFGINQRMAFHESCVRWALAWISPALALWLLLSLLPSPSSSSPSPHFSSSSPSPSSPSLSFPPEADVKHPRLHAARLHAAALPSHRPATAPPPPLPLASALYALPLLFAAFGLIGCFRRRKLRRKYALTGSTLSDFVCHCCCVPCSIAREAREIRTQVVNETLASMECSCDDFE